MSSGENPKRPTARDTRNTRDTRMTPAAVGFMETEDLTSKQIDNYRLTSRIAIGGAGTVYRAQNLRYKFPLALKILHPEKANDKKEVAALTQEFELGKSFNHPGILKYIDSGKYENRPYVVMNYFSGRTLQSCWRDEDAGKIIRRNIVELVTKMAQVVGYLHENRIIHRDIKPANFLVDLETLQVVLIDFSLATRQPNKLLGILGLGGNNETVGTPTYMSPEQILKKTPAPSMDIYSFGVMLFEFFAGRPPFVGASQNDVLNQILQKPVPSLTQFNHDYSDELAQFLTRALSKVPELRSQTMAQFAIVFARTAIYHS